MHEFTVTHWLGEPDTVFRKKVLEVLAQKLKSEGRREKLRVIKGLEAVKMTNRVRAALNTWLEPLRPKRLIDKFRSTDKAEASPKTKKDIRR